MSELGSGTDVVNAAGPKNPVRVGDEAESIRPTTPGTYVVALVLMTSR
jgi:hypothetical protein